MSQQSTHIPVADGAVPITVFRRAAVAGKPGPALVVMPSGFGISDDFRGQMEDLAADAGLVVALDPFWRGHAGPLAYSDFAPVMARLQALDRAKAIADHQAVIAWARSQPECDGRVIALGICFGGAFGFVAAAAGLVEGVATWHGGRLEQFLGDADKMTVPMSLHFGDKDRVIPMTAVEAVRTAFAGRANVDVHVYPGADHGFTHPTAPTYDAVACAGALAGVRRLLAA